MKGNHVLSVEHVTMQFGGVVAVNNLSLVVNPGEIVALIGPNGAGKTTAFNCITGVYEPTNGLVSFQGQPIIRNHPKGKMAKNYLGENEAMYRKDYVIEDKEGLAAIQREKNPEFREEIQKEYDEEIAARLAQAKDHDPFLFTDKVLNPTPDHITQLGIARTFQNIRLFSKLTVLENVLIGKHMRAKQNVFSATFRLAAGEERQMREEAMALLEEQHLAQYEKALCAPVESRAAILYDFDSLASLRIQRQSTLLDSQREMKKLHRVLFRAGVSVDVIPAQRDFSAYDLVLVPCVMVTDPDFAQRLSRYVAGGGVAVVTFRTAVKDRRNNLVFGKPLPVDLGEVLGLVVEETESVQEEDCFQLTGPGGSARAGIFRDMIAPTTAQVLWHYDDPFFRSYAAVTCNTYGQGAAYYLGTALEPSALEKVLHQAMDRAGLERLELPEGVETGVRGTGADRVRFLLNHNDVPVRAMGRELSPFQVLIWEE